MRVLSAIPGTIVVRVAAPRPMHVGQEEVVMPARAVALSCGVPLTLPDNEAAVVLGRRGGAGIIEIPAETKAEELPELLRKAKILRFNFLRQMIHEYRMQQGMRQASGRELLMPTENIRQCLIECKALQRELHEEDALAKELTDGLPVVQRPVTDVVAEELREFGIQPQAAPLYPGVTAWDETMPSL